MSRKRLAFESFIESSAAVLFELIADMPNYSRWLSGSRAFGGTTQVTPYPVCLGTTYLDAGSMGDRPGRVTAFDAPRYIEFHQTMTVKQWPIAAEIDITKNYTLEGRDRGTALACMVDLDCDVRGLSALASPLIVSEFKKENARVIEQLKRYAESLR